MKLQEILESQSQTDFVTGDTQLFIWVTNVVVKDCKVKFQQFMERYIDPDIDNDEISERVNLNEPRYMQKLDEIHQLNEPFLNVNCEQLKSFDAQLYRQIICYPQEVIPTFDMTVNSSRTIRKP